MGHGTGDEVVEQFFPEESDQIRNHVSYLSELDPNTVGEQEYERAIERAEEIYEIFWEAEQKHGSSINPAYS